MTGKVESGEDVQAAAKRELREETGIDATCIQLVMENLYTSGGISNFKISIGFAYCNLTEGMRFTQNGNACEQEVIAPQVMQLSDLMSRLRQNQIRSLPLHCLLNHLAVTRMV